MVVCVVVHGGGRDMRRRYHVRHIYVDYNLCSYVGANVVTTALYSYMTHPV